MPGIVLSPWRMEVDWCRRQIAGSMRLVFCLRPIRARTTEWIVR
jgi:hypothetical protein